MVKEVNFLADYEEEQALLKENAANELSDNESSESNTREKTGKIIQLCELARSQYVQHKSQKLWNFWVDDIFQLVSETAEHQCGRAKLSIDEEDLTGKITYWGHDLILSDAWGKQIDCYAAMIKNTSNLFISYEDGLIRFDITFSLYELEKVADKSEEIKALEKTMFSPEYIEKLSLFKD